MMVFRKARMGFNIITLLIIVSIRCVTIAQQ